MDSLREVAVKVNNGSGVLVKLDNKSYVITAIHCINETGDNTILSADESIKYKVEGMGDYPSFEMTSNVNSNDKVEAYGFPTKQRRGEPLSGSISQWNSDITTIKTELTYIGSNNDDEEARNNIEGWSGP